MSFSSTLYRISEALFRKIEIGMVKPRDLVNESKDFVTTQDSSDAIQFILKKRPLKTMNDLISEIFFPRENVGSVSDEEFEKLVASSNYEEIDRITASTFYFLSPNKVTALNSFLESLDSLEIRRLYDADELNAKGVYPGLWSADEDHDKAYNLFHVQNDLESLKRLFKNASIEKDYILTFNG